MNKYIKYSDGPEEDRKYICAVCNTEFIRHLSYQKYCGSKCSLIMRNKMSVSAKGHWIILNRDNYTCIYCGKSSIEHNKQLNVDHIHPRSLKGNNTAANLVTSCKDCNLSKFQTKLSEENFKRILQEVELRNQKNNIPSDVVIKL